MTFIGTIDGSYISLSRVIEFYEDGGGYFASYQSGDGIDTAEITSSVFYEQTDKPEVVVPPAGEIVGTVVAMFGESDFIIEPTRLIAWRINEEVAFPVVDSPYFERTGRARAIIPVPGGSAFHIYRCNGDASDIESVRSGLDEAITSAKDSLEKERLALKAQLKRRAA